MSAFKSQVKVYLGHGASGDASSMAPFVAGLRARGVDAVAIDLPKRKAEDAVPALLEIAPPGPWTVVGGHSYGGRVASLAAAEATYRGLVCFSYPLHAPGQPDRAAARIAHWPRIACPALLLCGEADPFARIELLRATMPTPAPRRAPHVPSAWATRSSRSSTMPSTGRPRSSSRCPTRRR